MVTEAKGLVTQIKDPRAQERWRSSNRDLLSAVGFVKQAVGQSILPTQYYHQHYQRSTSVNQPSRNIDRDMPIQEMQDLSLNGK